ncbi:hypothetical protein V5F77_00395 [Xanthobacter sp. DSM 24535]|uniref:hypothetical protein n=1 Tax=Roseixanthobacter psychrophilus TaxID=3119917 RepID=UPI0037268DAA
MMSDVEKLSSLLYRINSSKGDWIAEFVAAAIFEDGKLRGFPMQPIFENLTVQQFMDFLSAQSLKVQLGEPGARDIWLNHWPSNGPHGCRSEPNFTCIPT